MSNTVNKVILIARVGTAPEKKTLDNGVTVCNFTVATDKSYKKKTGESVEKTEWHRIVVWGKLADICSDFLSKGKLVYLEGEMQTREWIDKKDTKHYTTEINCSTMRMLSKKEEGTQVNYKNEEPVDKVVEDIPF